MLSANRRNFATRTVALTGGAGGIGRALAARFARAGAKIVLLDVDAEGLAEAARELEARGHEVLAVQCDITRVEECRAAAERIEQRFGGVDVLINNAGLVHRSAFRDTDVEVFRRVMEVNYFGSVNVTKALLDGLVGRRGLIIVVSSIAGLSPLYGRSGYSASKHALHGLFESLRSELAGSGVDVLMVCPSFTRTAFEQRALDARGGRVRRGRSKLGTEATPESVAESVYRAALQRRRLLVLSPVGKLSIWLSRIAPGLHTHLMARALRDELGEAT